MTSQYKVHFVFEGANNKQSRLSMYTTPITLASQEAEYAEAVTRTTDMVAFLEAVSDAPVVSAIIQYNIITSPGTPAGDVFEKAMLSLYLDSAGTKTGNFQIPAPSIGIFVASSGPNRDVVDATDGDLVDLVDEISNNWEISDGESVNTTVNSGIKVGRRLARLR